MYESVSICMTLYDYVCLCMTMYDYVREREKERERARTHPYLEGNSKKGIFVRCDNVVPGNNELFFVCSFLCKQL